MDRFELFLKLVRDTFPVGQFDIMVIDGDNIKVYDLTSASTAFISVSVVDLVKKAECHHFFNYDRNRRKVYMHVY